MGKKDTFFAGIGFQIVETDLILIYTKFRIFQWEPTELVGKHPASSQGVAEYTEPESNQWWEQRREGERENHSGSREKSISYSLNIAR